MTRPVDPNISIPSAFAINGTKTDFTNEKIQDGFDDTNPDILAGDNLNKFIDDTYKGLNYSMDGVDDLYDVTDDLKDLSNLSATGQAIIDNKASKDLNNLSATGEAHFANPDLSNLSNNGSNRLHALKGYLDNGTALTDSEGLADVINYAHSTFDVSKFTVVGTPTITDDGIASGFSTSNYVEIGNSNFASSNDYEIDIPFYSTSNTIQNTILATSRYATTDKNLGIVLTAPNTGNYRILLFAGTGTTWNIANGTTGVNNISADTNYLIKFIRKDGKYTVKLLNLDTGTETTEIEVTSSSSIGNISNLQIGSGGGWFSAATTCSIDLKQFSITVDGIPVFNGNKTGIDTIKPDNYTVVGTPTISADGIVSGFSNSNYIVAPNNFLSADTWKIEYPISATQTNQAGIIAILADFCLQIVYTPTDKQINYVLSSNGSSWDIASSSFVASSLDNTKDSTFVIEYTGTQYKLNIYQNDVNVGGVTIDNTAKLYQSNNQLILGNNRSQNSAVNGSIDLNAFKIYVDGNLVYQPCLKIPYTQSASKYGSKIVDAVYRDRVQDAWEQNFPQRYYTLDEVNGNFTLPQGEIYGMMLNKTVPHVIETYHSGTSWYRVWFDGWCEQGGVVFVPGQTGGQVTFIKPFATTDYSILVTNADYTYAHPSAPNNSTKSTNGIVIDNYDGELDTYAYWEAKGYIS